MDSDASINSARKTASLGGLAVPLLKKRRASLLPRLLVVARTLEGGPVVDGVAALGLSRAMRARPGPPGAPPVSRPARGPLLAPWLSPAFPLDGGR